MIQSLIKSLETVLLSSCITIVFQLGFPLAKTEILVNKILKNHKYANEAIVNFLSCPLCLGFHVSWITFLLLFGFNIIGMIYSAFLGSVLTFFLENTLN